MSEAERQLIPAKSKQAILWTPQDERKLESMAHNFEIFRVGAFLASISGAATAVLSGFAVLQGDLLGLIPCVVSAAMAGGSLKGYVWLGKRWKSEHKRRLQILVARATRLEEAAQDQLKAELDRGPVRHETRLIFPDPDYAGKTLTLTILPIRYEQNLSPGADTTRFRIHEAKISGMVDGHYFKPIVVSHKEADKAPGGELGPLLTGPQPPIPLPRLESPRRLLPEPAAIPARPGRDAVPPDGVAARRYPKATF